MRTTFFRTDKENNKWKCTRPDTDKAFTTAEKDFPVQVADKLKIIYDKEIVNCEGLETLISFDVNLLADETYYGIVNYRIDQSRNGHKQHRFNGTLELTEDDKTKIKAKETEIAN